MNEQQAGAHRELRSSFTLRTVAAAFGMVATFGLTVVVVRTLDSKDAAGFFAILAALSIGPLVGRLGLGPNIIRLMPAATDAQSRRRIAGSHLRVTLLLSVLSAPVVALFATAGLISHGDFPYVFLLTTVVIIIETVRLMLSDIFAAVGRVSASVMTMHYIRSVMVLPAVGVVALMSEKPTLTVLLITYAGAAAIQLVGAVWFARTEVSWFGRMPIATLLTAVRAGSKLFSLELAAFLMMSGTIWLANGLFSADTATKYSAAAALAMQVTILESLTALAATPPAARLWAAGRRDEVTRLLSNVATLNTVVTTGIVLVLAVVGSFALEIAYGPSLESAAIYLVILAAAGIFQAAFNVNIALLIVAGHVEAVSRTALVVLLVAIPVAVAAALLGGPLALAIASAAAVATLSVAEWLTARTLFDTAPRAHLDIRAAISELRPSRNQAEPVAS